MSYAIVFGFMFLAVIIGDELTTKERSFRI